jgi:hypothetical protein
LERQCYVVRDATGHALAYINFGGRARLRSAAHLMTREEARRIAVNVAKLPELPGKRAETRCGRLAK